MKSLGLFKVFSLIYSVVVLFLMCCNVVKPAAWFAFAFFAVVFVALNQFHVKSKSWNALDMFYASALGFLAMWLLSGFIICFFLFTTGSLFWTLGLVPFAWSVIYAFWIRKKVWKK